MSLWKRTMDYLGLGPDDAYDDYDDYDEPVASARPTRGTRDAEARPNGSSSSQRGWEPEEEPTVRTVSARPSFPSRDFRRIPVTTRSKWALRRFRRPGQAEPGPATRTAQRSGRIDGTPHREATTVRPGAGGR